jgi:hypothetical protein
VGVLVCSPGGHREISGLKSILGTARSRSWQLRGREEQLLESEQKIAALERKVGQLTMELDLLKKGLAAARSQNNGSSSIISGPGASPSRGGAA